VTFLLHLGDTEIRCQDITDLLATATRLLAGVTLSVDLDGTTVTARQA
jgi:hypothetical protein